MSNKPQRSASPLDEDYPEDLFDEPLETLSAPNEQNCNNDASVEQNEVGYRKPPKHTQWKKGCPSPNPLGRPCKQRNGALTKRMEESVEYADSRGKVTRREALDLLVRNKAIKEGRRWLDFWEERKGKDQSRRQKAAADSQRSGAAKHVDMVAKRVRQQTRFYDAIYTFIVKYFPGVLETERRLREADIVVKTKEGYRLTDRGKMLIDDRAPFSPKSRSSMGPPETEL